MRDLKAASPDELDFDRAPHHHHRDRQEPQGQAPLERPQPASERVESARSAICEDHTDLGPMKRPCAELKNAEGCHAHRVGRTLCHFEPGTKTCRRATEADCRSSSHGVANGQVAARAGEADCGFNADGSAARCGDAGR